ncbi:MAG: zinc-ribbon domain-containing protein [Ruminococcaceae bacterium]|nr:zinc-ribbon domain-containing protein [Oscillospiraceae bacterium]
MSKYCQNCGNAINENEKFCGSCGAPVTAEQPAAQPYQETNPSFNSFYSAPSIAPGFSRRVNDPEILAAVKKNKKAGKLFAFLIIPLPLIGFVVYSLVTEKMELNQALMAGGFVSFVFLICTLISAIKSRSSKSYEAVVTDKKQRERAEHSNDDNTSYYTQYITYAKTDDGKKKKIVETDRGIVAAYNYLPVGARFKYHPQFAFPYELYDKANAPYIVCVACGTHNEVTNDRCSRCNVPLLK